MALSANSAAFVFAHPERNIVLGCNKASLRKTHSLRETINMFIELDSKTSEKPPEDEHEGGWLGIPKVVFVSPHGVLRLAFVFVS